MRTLLGLPLLVLFSSASAAAQTPRCPNVLIAFDVSGSMRSPAFAADGGVSTRWQVGRDAIRALVQSADPSLRLGLELFGDVSFGGTVCSISPATCSYPQQTACNSVTCGYDTRSAISAVVDRLTTASIAGNTPTGPAVDTAATRDDMKDATRPRYLVLVTDGEPFSCVSGSSDPYLVALAAITSIRQGLGVRTFVLGFGDSSSFAAKLAGMATAGGTAPPGCDAGACFFSATNGAELESALNSIVAQVSGEFTTGGCDDSCYGQGCPSGSVCIAASCTPPPPCQAPCPQGSACVDGQCQAFCQSACKAGERCDHGQCVPDSDCPGGCSGKNRVCVGGLCVENYCSGLSLNLAAQCPPGFVCDKNACMKAPDLAVVPGADAGVDGGTTPASFGREIGNGGCTCATTPSAFAALALLGAAFFWRRGVHGSRRRRE